MNIGRLNHRVTIQRNIEYEDEHGITIEEWTDLNTVWCSMNNLHGKEYWEAKQYSAENTIEFVIRYNACKDLSIKDRLKQGNKLFNITSIDNVLYKNEIFKIKALEVI
jgi:SPP1 family predicted phage head-tail adaptor